MNSTDPLHKLFDGRSPEGVARQLAITLAWLTECQLATLEGLRSRKSTAKSEIDRQQSVCDQAVAQCADLGIGPDVRGLRGHPCPRLSEALLLRQRWPAAPAAVVPSGRSSDTQSELPSMRERHQG